ncbi:hypothetical protein BDM02DRAFT_3269514 [Thelephora ganbajun]|uniref:Uncharacterized protein n=1 Tax=Thelephora ganbajun TaxID=370292 RepID=A0ACB6ZF11_THEGA|nr:hypothetical protein BDM02DRAFT_3269514 [Thelephora ganbajun]
MPSPSFLAKAFVAGFLFGHLLIPTEKSWLFKLARSPAFDITLPILSDSNAASTRNGSLQVQDANSPRYLANDNPPVLLHPSLGNLSSSSNLTTGLHFTPTRSPTNQPTFSREISALVLPNNSNPITYRPSATQTTASTTLYYVYGVPSASARPPIPIVIPPHHPSGPDPSFQFGLTFRSLLCVSILLYHITPLIYCKWRPKRKTRMLPERVVSMIIANLERDPQSLKTCSLVSRSWTKESHQYLFHTISLSSKQSADLWFSPDTLSLADNVRSIRLSMEAIAGAERGLGRFSCVKTLRISGWRGSQHSSLVGLPPLDRTVDHLELVQPEGTPHEILTLVSFFTSLESLYITRSHQQSRCEVRATHAGDPAVVSLRFRTLRQPPVDGGGLTRPCPGNGISVWLHFDPQDIDEPLTVLLGCSDAQTTRACGRCFTGRSLAYPLSRLIHPHSGRPLSILRIDTLPEEMIGMTDSLLISLPCISPRSTKVTIERFSDIDAISVDEILPKFRSLGGVVEIGEQRIRI